MKTYGAEQKTYLVQEVQAKKPAGVIGSGCEKSIIVEKLADMLSQNGMDIGVIRLYQWLREHGYVYRLPGGRNMPTKKSLEFGVLEVRKRQYDYACGKKYTASTLVVTPKGQEYFMLLLGDKETCRKTESA